MSGGKASHPSLWTGGFARLCGLNLLIFLSFHMLTSTFPFYIKELGGDEALAGLAAGAFSIASLCTRPFAGYIIDSRGRRGVLLIGLAGMVLLPASYIFCTLVALAIFLRLLQGTAWAFASTALNTMAGDLIPKHRFGEGMGYFGLSSALATAISPYLGLLLMERFGFTTLFMTVTVLVFLTIFFSRALPVLPLKAGGPGRDLRHSLRRLLNRDALPASVMMFLFLLPQGCVTTFIAYYASISGLPNGGLYFTCLAVATAMARLLTGHLADVRGEGVIVVASCTSMLTALLLLAFAPNDYCFFVSAILQGLAFGAMTPALQAMALRIVAPERRGAASSTYLCAFDIGMGLGGMTGGVLAQYLGYQAMFTLISLGAAASLIVYLCWGRRHPSSFSYQKRTPGRQG